MSTRVLSGTQNGSGTTVTLTAIDVGSGSNRYFAIAINDQGVGASAVTAVTYAGAAMTRILGPTQFGPSAGGNNYVSVWGIVNPTSGSNSVVITQSSAVGVFTNYVAYTGANQSTPINTSIIAGATSATGTQTQTVTTTVNGCGLVHFVFNQTDSNVYTVGTRTIDNGGGAQAVSDPEPQATAGAYTFTWTITGANSGTRLAMAIIAIAPVGGGPAPRTQLTMMGVG